MSTIEICFYGHCCDIGNHFYHWIDITHFGESQKEKVAFGNRTCIVDKMNDQPEIVKIVE